MTPPNLVAERAMLAAIAQGNVSELQRLAKLYRPEWERIQRIVSQAGSSASEPAPLFGGSR